MDNNWKCIYKTKKVYRAEILKGVLLENEIAAVVLNKQDSAYLFGEAELYVQADDVIVANKIISEVEF